MGTGKSSLGNCLLGRDAFAAKRSARAVTATLAVGSSCAEVRHALQQAKNASVQQVAAAVAAGTAAGAAAAAAEASSVVQLCPPLSPEPPPVLRPLVVVDSPGFGDPSRSTTALLHEIKVHSAASCATLSCSLILPRSRDTDPERC